MLTGRQAASERISARTRTTRRSHINGIIGVIGPPRSCRYSLKTMGWTVFLDPEPTAGFCRPHGLPIATQTSNQISFNEAGKPESPRPTCATEHHAKPLPNDHRATNCDSLRGICRRWNCGSVGCGKRCADIHVYGSSTRQHVVVRRRQSSGNAADCRRNPA